MLAKTCQLFSCPLAGWNSTPQADTFQRPQPPYNWCIFFWGVAFNSKPPTLALPRSLRHSRTASMLFTQPDPRLSEAVPRLNLLRGVGLVPGMHQPTVLGRGGRRLEGEVGGREWGQAPQPWNQRSSFPCSSSHLLHLRKSCGHCHWTSFEKSWFWFLTHEHHCSRTGATG